MFATLVSVALFALPAFATTFSIETPKSLVACSSQQFTWTGGRGPYNLVIVEADSPCGDILYQFPDTNSTSLTWSSVVLAAEYEGKKVSLSLEDADENEAWSTAITYSTGSNSTCIPGHSSSSAAASSVAPTTATIAPVAVVTATAGGGATAAGAVGNAGALGDTSGAFSTQMSGSALAAAAAFGLAALSL
ncbi:hypothetical protein FIBSPDRAFT_929452 [Athelia psychrophila]|uniref:Uncharacterized protein n=1 Tax=Athelia psychrophila TaxID=1759441 RepID=A0A165WJ78_9AGAM|nr:hypothetical protein FIBSPDRAFT_939382 [Fibularhizoctonia sp. CBS 109695]KZP25195.1 hypothetical protein FIBSPDRAFT_929452 [Fibularhizoctonia sp. CBS 109695]